MTLSILGLSSRRAQPWRVLISRLPRGRRYYRAAIGVNANFRVETEALDDMGAVNVWGELDQATVPELRRALDKVNGAGNASVFVDLSDCEFIDSTGLSLLVEMQRKLADDNRGFAVCCPRAEVRRLLELTGIDAAVGLFETRDEAIASLRTA